MLAAGFSRQPRGAPVCGVLAVALAAHLALRSALGPRGAALAGRKQQFANKAHQMNPVVTQ